jgi:hypothetical protein
MMTTPKPYVPLPRVVHESDAFRLELEYLPHPLRDGLLVSYRLEGDDDLEFCPAPWWRAQGQHGYATTVGSHVDHSGILMQRQKSSTGPRGPDVTTDISPS